MPGLFPRLSHTLSAAALVALTSLPASAGVLVGIGIPVQPQDDQRFVVDYIGESRADIFWCAAGQYVTAHLGLPPTTRIFRATPVKASLRDGMLFSLNEADSVGKSGMMVLNDDGGLTAGMAQASCDYQNQRF